MKKILSTLLLLLIQTACTETYVTPPSIIVRVETSVENFPSVEKIFDQLAAEIHLPKNDRSSYTSESVGRQVLAIDYDDGVGLVPLHIKIENISDPGILDIIVFEKCDPECPFTERIKTEIAPTLGVYGKVSFGNPRIKAFSSP